MLQLVQLLEVRRHEEFEPFDEVKLATEPRSYLGQTLLRPRFTANLNPGLTYPVVCTIQSFYVGLTSINLGLDSA